MHATTISSHTTVLRRVLAVVSVALAAGLAAAPVNAQVCQDCVRYIDSAYTSATISSTNLSFEIPFDVVACDDDDGAALVVAVSIIRNAGSAPSVSSVTWDADDNGSADDALSYQAGASTNSDTQQDSDRKRVEMWLVAGPTETPGGDSGSVTVSYASGATGEVVAGAVQACGVNQTIPVINRATSNNQTTQTFAAVAPTTAEGSLLLDILAVDGDITPTKAYGFMVENWNDDTGTTSANLSSASSRISSRQFTTYVGSVQETRFNLSSSTLHAFGALTLNPNSTTSSGIELASAAAGRKGVTLSWRTDGEPDTAGFNVYRDSGGELDRVNDHLISGSALAFGTMSVQAGHGYRWLVPGGAAGDEYWIEELLISGRRELHGPITAVTGADRGPISRTVPELAVEMAHRTPQTRLVRTDPGDVSKSSAREGGGRAESAELLQWRIAGRPALKITVEEDGWYRVTRSDLEAEGIDTSWLDFDRLRLVREGVEQAIRLVGAEDGVPGPNDGIEFFGRVSGSATSSASVYWLFADRRPFGARVAVEQQTGQDQATVASFTESVEVRERSVYVAGVLNGPEENFFGDVIAADPVTTSIQTPGAVADASDATVTVAIQGFLDGPRSILVSLNDTELGQLDFDGNEWRQASFGVSADLLVDGENSVELAPVGDGLSLVDRIRVDYTRRTTAVSESLDIVLPSGADEPFAVDGFASDRLFAVDVSRPDRPVEIVPTIHPAQDGDYAATLAPAVSSGPTDAAQRRLLVFSDEAVKRPASLEMNTRSSWYSARNANDLVIIGPQDLLAAAAPLAQLRETEGLGTALVDIEDVYDEFAFGHKDPAAIQRFLARASAAWKTAPRYVLLFGDATYDPKDYLGYGGDLVPTGWIESGPYETASDDGFADLDGDDRVDLAIGRLPAANAAEAEAMVAKILAYEQAAGAPGSALIIADAPQYANFDVINERIAAAVAPIASAELLSATGLDPDAARTEVISGLNTGHWLVHYSGHGGIDSWRQGILTNEDAGLLTNTDNPSLFVMMNCLNGAFQEPLLASLGESLLRADGGGLAIWASTGTTDPALQEAMMHHFYGAVSEAGAGVRIGDAIVTAKTSMEETSVPESWVLLGDPSLNLR